MIIQRKGVCYNCKDRVLGCHADCEKYKAEIEERKRMNQAVRKDRIYTDYQDEKTNRIIVSMLKKKQKGRKIHK